MIAPSRNRWTLRKSALWACLISPREVSPSSSERHIKTSRVVEEADALVLIGPHAGQDDEVLLSALEGIHTGYFHFLLK